MTLYTRCAFLQVGMMHMWKTLADRLLFFKTDANWYTILYKAAFALFGATDSFYDEFAAVQLSSAAATSATRKSNSAALEAVESMIFDKLCKQQRSKLNSRQLHALAELKSSSVVQSLYSVPCLQREQSQAAIQYARPTRFPLCEIVTLWARYSIDSSFIFLASRDGSSSEGHVVADALLLEAAWWWCGVCAGDEDAFDSVIAPRASIGAARLAAVPRCTHCHASPLQTSADPSPCRARRGPPRLHPREQPQVPHLLLLLHVAHPRDACALTPQLPLEDLRHAGRGVLERRRPLDQRRRVAAGA
jgi:hypothetical protein